jgi:hypothetical protein|tara:strand:- start:1617 stop:1796 length:180 start_codon:yes stop_codon:yes gene_type:complete
LYIPGAINLHIWLRKNGIESNKEAKKVSFKGAKKGEATSVAIIEEPVGRKLRRGLDSIR